ncbi:MdtA/MuxA family multidrug efflux RND transporter periplasmic adaptor subunit [Stutzerimonas tarimensis]|uniref:MdtA/MuxA family multidrug efflux RND transporter periplasmic adaptor subunit n=1 Tax=Stutzerimonas tarimensis TaxID=1507735 RepID=A0ABV7T7F4_9GAMM
MMVCICIVVVMAVAWWLWPSADQPSQQGGRPGFGGSGAAVPVRVADVDQRPFEVFHKALGTVTPLNTVNVRSRVAGELMEVHFTEGQRVEAGQLLAVIDPRPYQVALNQAQGMLQQNQALLRNAQVDLDRYKGLFAEDSIARQTLDTQQAQVEQYRGTLASDQAAVEEARLNLEYTRIHSPIEGRLGLRQLDVGNLLTANAETPLVVITQTQPIAVSFTLPEGHLTPVVSRFRQGEALVVQAWDRGERELLAEGVLQSLDNQIDAATGTLRLKAQFDNNDELLLPNQFVNVRLRVQTLDDAVVVPSASIQYGARGAFVYVVDEQSLARIRSVELGPADGALTVVLGGLAGGDRVVMEGTDRLRDGSAVDVVGRAGEALEEPAVERLGR